MASKTESSPLGHQVVVVGDRRRAAQGELGQADGRGDADILDGDARPDRVELLEPGEQVTAGGTTASEPLVEVMVGVDQPGGDDAAVAGDHLVTRPRGDDTDLGDRLRLRPPPHRASVPLAEPSVWSRPLVPCAATTCQLAESSSDLAVSTGRGPGAGHRRLPGPP